MTANWIRRNKNSGRRKQKPDAVHQFGPITVAQYDNKLLLHNGMTSKQHSEYLKRTEERHGNLSTEIKKSIVTLQGLISNYDPLELMHMCVLQVLPILTKQSADDKGDSNALAALEYLQFLIARTSFHEEKTELDNTNWEEVWSTINLVLEQKKEYITTAPPSAIPPTQLDQLWYNLELRKLAMRIRRYHIFFVDYIKSSFEPYEPWLRNRHGITAQELIDGILTIDKHQITGILDKQNDLYYSFGRMMDDLAGQGFNIAPDSDERDADNVKAAFDAWESSSMYEEISGKFQSTMTPELFEITNLTQLPKSLLSLLSVKPSESIIDNAEESTEGIDPLSTSLLHRKPFLEVDGRFYSFYHSGFEDRISEIIEADLFANYPNKQTVMVKKRTERLENDARILFENIMMADFMFQNAYYPNPDKEDNNLTELDLLFGIGDILFLVEVKAGGFSEDLSIKKELSKLIIGGQQQSRRAEKYIKSGKKVSFYDHTGKNVIHEIAHENFRTIFRVVITKEFLGWAGAKIDNLTPFDSTLQESYPWHVSIDDLRAISALFKGKAVEFIHYLEQRLAASSETSLMQQDELEHVALYHKINHYHDVPQGMNWTHFDNSFMEDIDQYFFEKQLDREVSLPAQEMSPNMKDLIEALNASSLMGRFEVGSTILSLDYVGRNKLDSMMSHINSRYDMGKQPCYRLPLPSEMRGLTFTYANEENLEIELISSAALMLQGGHIGWIVVQLGGYNPYRILKIEHITPERFSAKQIAEAYVDTGFQIKDVIRTHKLTRNDSCPCGSGRKVKKCHGLN